MRTPPKSCAPRPEPRGAAAQDTLRELLRLEQQSPWTTRRLRAAVLPLVAPKPTLA